jgi:putative ABC transport system permease protein
MLSRPLSTSLSLILLALGVGIISLILQINHRIQAQLDNNLRGIDMVMGAKGSPLQLILSAVYHIDDPTGNISLREAGKLQHNRLVASSVPLSYGDSYQGFRIVGTTHQYPELYAATLAQGRLWQKPLEVTLGAGVAQQLKLKPGDTFSGAHGLSEGGETHEEHAYRVVGILNYSNSVLDQLILTATESVWQVHQHEHAGGEHNHGEAEEEDTTAGEQEITAMLVKFRSPMGMLQLPRMINENTTMQAAVPAYEISRLFNLMGVGLETLRTLAVVIMVVSGLSVFISLYNALKDRKFELALMRTYGASRGQLVWLVVQEGVLLTLLGFVLGILGSRLGLWLTTELVAANYHYDFTSWVWLPEESRLLLAALALGLLASLLPALKAFNINISKTLANG